MPDFQRYRPYGIAEYLKMSAARLLLWAGRKWPALCAPPFEDSVDTYASAMAPRFNWLHRIIFPRFFKKIHVETDNLDHIHYLAQNATLVYVSKDIGQLEYNFFNYLLLKEDLPLARFVNELSLWTWLPAKQIRRVIAERAERFTRYGPLPHPVASGYLGALIENGSAAFIQLKSTAIFNDLYWYRPNEDPLAALVAAHERSSRPIYIVPLHFLWNKRPEGSVSLLNIIPGRLGRVLRFWRSYKNKAVVKIGAPLDSKELTTSNPAASLNEKTKILRTTLLDILKQEKKSITGPALKPRSWIIDQMLEDEVLQKVIYNLSLERNQKIDDVKLLAKRYAQEIAADINYNYVEICCRLMKWFLKNIYDNVVIDADGLARLKKVASRAPVILVPNHRSHMDYLVLSAILYENNVTIPHVAAGLNMSFWPMGHIFRKCGAFFIRRAFSGNFLYAAVFKTYLKVLLNEGYCQEFFIEGTRSRTGKLLRPKTGMINMLLASMREGAAKEVHFVPVAVTYDHVIEKYEKEVGGEVKKTERTRDLLSLGRHLRKKHGRIYIRFGEPILHLDTGEELAPAAAKLVPSIMLTINRELVATPAAVTAAAILASPKRGISHEELITNAEEIIKYLKWRGVPQSTGLASDIKLVAGEAIERFIQAKDIEVHEEFTPVCYEIKENKRVELDYYKNNIIHFFVSASCLASIILANLRKGKTDCVIDSLKDSYLFCKRLFAYEFAFSTRLDVEEHIKRTLSYFEGGEIIKGTAGLELLKSLLTNFFEAYLAVLSICKGIPPTEERQLLKTITKYSNHMLLLGRITRPEAISTPIFKNALLSLTSMDILKQETDLKGRKTYSWTGNADTAEKVKLLLEELC